jgi:hypothetical protein
MLQLVVLESGGSGSITALHSHCAQHQQQHNSLPHFAKTKQLNCVHIPTPDLMDTELAAL